MQRLNIGLGSNPTQITPLHWNWYIYEDTIKNQLDVLKLGCILDVELAW